MPSQRTRTDYERLRVTDIKRSDAIDGSQTEPSIVLSAADVGAAVTITVASHVRRYSDGTSVNIVGAPLTGLSFGTPYAVYYDDPSRTVLAPTFHATATVKQAANNYVLGRHFVGNLTTPADGGGATTGGTYPPGGGGNYAIP